ncbi:MAG: hypothetical protein NVSMB17_18360 [Candidatus Dormibacteria bacterium]
MGALGAGIPKRPAVRVADPADMEIAARLLRDFNTEYGERSPELPHLATTLRRLLADGDTEVLLGGDGPDGISVLRFRAAIWSDAPECYLAELYVAPARRGRGLGRMLLEASMELARLRGADRIELGTSEADATARALYESVGFTNLEGGPGGPVMYYYEREL